MQEMQFGTSARRDRRVSIMREDRFLGFVSKTGQISSISSNNLGPHKCTYSSWYYLARPFIHWARRKPVNFQGAQMHIHPFLCHTHSNQVSLRLFTPRRSDWLTCSMHNIVHPQSHVWGLQKLRLVALQVNSGALQIFLHSWDARDSQITIHCL